MLGNDDDPGITVLAVRQLFEENESDRTFMIRVDYIEIYNEKVYDLLTDRNLVTINQNGDNDIKLTNKEVLVKDCDTVLNLLALGNKLRNVAQSNMNEASSRSHAIFRIIIESEDVTGNGPVRVSYLNLVDLSGSEKANDAGTCGTRLKESNDINKSLLHLGMVIRALSEGKKFVNVRSSKLTRILRASLGGNVNTAIICNITPAAIDETASTLGFANQAKAVKNEAKCNEVFTPEQAFMKQMQAEVRRLQTELQESNKNEKKLRAEIAQKEPFFLIGRNMRVKADRRKTWHHTTSFNVHSIIPQAYSIEFSVIDNHEAMTSDLSVKFENQLHELKAELKAKQQLIDNHDAMTSDLNAKFHNQLRELKSELQLKQNKVDENDQLISKLQSELTKKENDALSARNVIASLESQLRLQELKFSSVATQTDTSDGKCSCESMNLKISELIRQVAVETPAQKLEMENHPLIGENNGLKRALHDKQAELKLLNMDVDHYKRKWEQEKKESIRQCYCLSKVMESKGVQFNCDEELGGQQNVTNSQNGFANGQNGPANSGIGNVYLEQFNQYCLQIIPTSYQAAKEKIKELERVEVEIKNERVKIIRKR